ncbi:hypothetical protein C0J50_4706 [Silurus asotus]|uniref:Matrix-remodeling-associated protein 7 helical domain-containing protein n=1 Tax=Silurus asotus TaxID=30991 RepID=A0AAD5FDH4_SILAS|nr:hypothetical protein C0J50_4706 [Silurus asotus]
MDASMDMWVILLSVLSTIIAGFLTAVLFKGNQSGWGKTRPGEAFPACKEKQETTTTTTSISKKAPTGHGISRDESDRTAQTNEDLQDETCAREMVEAECNQSETKMDESSYYSEVNRMADEDQALRYMPGMLRTSQLEKMMSKEELEEEQRVQREQLSAILKLLKENQDTFGEVTEKDMEEQLKLYSI